MILRLQWVQGTGVRQAVWKVHKRELEGVRVLLGSMHQILGENNGGQGTSPNNPGRGMTRHPYNWLMIWPTELSLSPCYKELSINGIRGVTSRAAVGPAGST